MKFRTSRKIFIHIDCDSFFAECEILKNFKLKNKYVIVWEEIVIACNYKTKALWIKTWMPVWEAKNILWNKWIFLNSDHNFYNLVSYKMMNYLKDNTLSMEPFSIDEAFCEITGLPELYKMSLEDYIKKLQNDVINHIWVPVSIWVSTTKIKAKIFSKLNKPKWIYIDLWNSKELYQKLPISIVPFIWPSMQKTLKYKCNNIYDFISLGFDYLKKNIWKNATDLWLELSWVNYFIVKKNPESKSMSRWRSFNKNITNSRDFLYSQLLQNFNHLYEEFTMKNLELKKISLFFRNKEKQTMIFHYILKEKTFLRTTILKIIQKLFIENYDKNILYRSSWVVFSNLEKKNFTQLSLFKKNNKKQNCNKKLISTINKINNKFNSHKISFWTYLLDKNFDSKLDIRK